MVTKLESQHLFTDRRVKTRGDEPLRGEVLLPDLPDVAVKRDSPTDTFIRLVAEHPLLVTGAGLAGLAVGVTTGGRGINLLRRTGRGAVGALLGLSAGAAASAIAQRAAGTSSPTTRQHVREVAGAGSAPRDAGRDGEPLRVMDWNLREFTGPDSSIGFSDDAFAAVTETVRREQPDVLILQEVGVNTAVSNRTDQLAMLSDELGATGAVFIPNGRRPDGGLKGSAVLTFGGAVVQDARGLYSPDPGGGGIIQRLGNGVGLLEHVGIDVPAGWKRSYYPRTVGDVLVTTAGGTDVRVVDAHLSWGADSGRGDGSTDSQQRQLVPLARTLGAWQGATIMAGDFNVDRAHASGRFEAAELGRAGLTDSFDAVGVARDDAAVNSYSSTKPHKNIDRVYSSPELRATGARVVTDDPASRGSDHLPVVVDLVVDR